MTPTQPQPASALPLTGLTALFTFFASMHPGQDYERARKLTAQVRRLETERDKLKRSNDAMAMKCSQLAERVAFAEEDRAERDAEDASEADEWFNMAWRMMGLVFYGDRPTHAELRKRFEDGYRSDIDALKSHIRHFAGQAESAESTIAALTKRAEAAEKRCAEVERELSEWRQVMGEDNTQSVRESNKLRRLIETDLRERLTASEARASRAEGELAKWREIGGRERCDLVAALVQRNAVQATPTTPGERVGERTEGLTAAEAMGALKSGKTVSDRDGDKYRARDGYFEIHEGGWHSFEVSKHYEPFRIVEEP
jgi:hypothetical protein